MGLVSDDQHWMVRDGYGARTTVIVTAMTNAKRSDDNTLPRPLSRLLLLLLLLLLLPRRIPLVRACSMAASSSNGTNVVFWRKKKATPSGGRKAFRALFAATGQAPC